MSAIPRSLKPIKAFLARAEEIDRDRTKPESPLIAYYCRFYAVSRAVEIIKSDTSDETRSFVLALMEQVEAQKQGMPVFTAEEGKHVMTMYALEVFDVADQEDRAGGATKVTAHRFYACSTLLEALQQFGDLDEDLQSKIEDLRKTRKEIDRIFALRATARESKLFRESHLEMLLQRRQRSQRSFSRLRPPNAQRHRAMALAANKRLADARRVPSPDGEVATVTRVGDAQV